MSLLKINVGAKNYVLPSLENCLRAGDARFNSVQNAIRLHEWLGSDEVVAPVLESVMHNATRVDNEKLELGMKHQIYLGRNTSDMLFMMERRMLALPSAVKVMKDNIEVIKERDLTSAKDALQTTAELADEIINQTAYFNATAMYHGSEIPGRFIFEDITVLHYLVSAILTQRRKEVYQPTVEIDYDVIPQLYKVEDLAHIVSLMHQAMYEGNFPNPNVTVLEYNFLNVDFFCECAMAFSYATNTEIPTAYILKEVSLVFHWAVGCLTWTKRQVEPPEPKKYVENVVQLFGKK